METTTPAKREREYNVRGAATLVVNGVPVRVWKGKGDRVCFGVPEGVEVTLESAERNTSCSGGKSADNL